MKSSAIGCAVLALSLTVAGAAFAQGDGDIEQQRQATQAAERANRMRSAQRDYDQKRERERAYGQDARRDGPQWGERGAGPDHRFYRGDRLPYEYRSRQYVVEDWRRHRLTPPPQGHQWVQVGGDYVLVAIATGVILQLLLNN